MDTYADTHAISCATLMPDESGGHRGKLSQINKYGRHRSEGLSPQVATYREVVNEAVRTHTITANRTGRYRPIRHGVQVAVAIAAVKEALVATSVTSIPISPDSLCGSQLRECALTDSRLIGTTAPWIQCAETASRVWIGSFSMSNHDSLLTTDQTAQILACSRSTVCRLIRTGELESIQLRRARRISRSAIDRYIADQQKIQRYKAVGF